MAHLVERLYSMFQNIAHGMTTIIIIIEANERRMTSLK
jgi:hypothetical protein